MSYNNNGGNNRSNKNSKYGNNNNRPRNKVMTFELVSTFYSKNNTEMDREAVMDVLESLDDDGIFTVLSTPVQIARGLLFNDNEKKGNMNVGYITSVNREKNTVDVTIYSTSVAKIEDLCLAYKPRFVPNMISAKDGSFVTFVSFDLVLDNVDNNKTPNE